VGSGDGFLVGFLVLGFLVGFLVGDLVGEGVHHPGCGLLVGGPHHPCGLLVGGPQWGLHETDGEDVGQPPHPSGRLSQSTVAGLPDGPVVSLDALDGGGVAKMLVDVGLSVGLVVRLDALDGGEVMTSLSAVVVGLVEVGLSVSIGFTTA